MRLFISSNDYLKIDNNIKIIKIYLTASGLTLHIANNITF